MASTVEDLTRLAIIGIYNDLENDKPSQYFLVGSLIYLLGPLNRPWLDDCAALQFNLLQG